MIRRGLALLLCLAAFSLETSRAQSRPVDGQQARSGHHASPSASADAAPESGLAIPDVLLLDQQGRKVRFYSGLVKGKVVAINFIFTTCTTICPPMGATFAKVQKLLGDRGKDVHLISVTLDPLNDTPERLRAWAAKFDARPGWTLVTGPKPEVDRLLRALGSYVPQKEDHAPLVLVGNDSLALWTRADGLRSAAKLVKVIDEVSQGFSADNLQEHKQP